MDAVNDEGSSPSTQEGEEFSLESMGFTSFGRKVQPPKYLQQQQQQQILSGTATNLTPLGSRSNQRSSVEDLSIASSSLLPPPIPVPPPGVDTFEYTKSLNNNTSYEALSHKGNKSKRGRREGGTRNDRGGGRGGGFQQRGTHSYHPYSRPFGPQDTSASEANSDDLNSSGQTNPGSPQRNQYIDPIFGPGYYNPSFIEDPWKNLK